MPRSYVRSLLWPAPALMVLHPPIEINPVVDIAAAFFEMQGEARHSKDCRRFRPAVLHSNIRRKTAGSSSSCTATSLCLFDNNGGCLASTPYRYTDAPGDARYRCGGPLRWCNPEVLVKSRDNGSRGRFTGIPTLHRCTMTERRNQTIKRATHAETRADLCRICTPQYRLNSNRRVAWA